MLTYWLVVVVIFFELLIGVQHLLSVLTSSNHRPSGIVLPASLPRRTMRSRCDMLEHVWIDVVWLPEWFHVLSCVYWVGTIQWLAWACVHVLVPLRHDWCFLWALVGGWRLVRARVCKWASSYGGSSLCGSCIGWGCSLGEIVTCTLCPRQTWCVRLSVRWTLLRGKPLSCWTDHISPNFAMIHVVG